MKGLLGNLVMFYGCEVMWEWKGWVLRRQAHTCRRACVAGERANQHGVCVARAWGIPLLNSLLEPLSFQLWPSTTSPCEQPKHTLHEPGLRVPPVRSTRLSPQEGRRLEPRVFRHLLPLAPCLDLVRCGLWSLHSKDFIRLNHLHVRPLQTLPADLWPSIITAC